MRLLSIIFGAAFLLVLCLLRVEGGLNHGIIAGAVVDPLTNVDAIAMRLKYPVGGCAHPLTGDLFLCDYDEQTNPSKGFNRIFKVDANSKLVSVYAGNGLDQFGSGDGFDAIYAGLKPLTCTCDKNGDLYILDAHNNNIRMVNGSSKIISLVVNGTSIFDSPNALASDDTYIYISDMNNNLIKKINKATKQLSNFAGGGASTADNVQATTAILSKPSGVAVAPDGSVYFCDSANNIVRKVDANGDITTVAGTRGSGCGNGNTDTCGDGAAATSALLDTPKFVHLRKDGTLIIADSGRIRAVSPQGTISTLAGTGTSGVSKTGGPTGDGIIGTSVVLQTSKDNVPSLHGLFGYDNVVYFNDKVARRYRKILENGIVDHAFGGSISSNPYFGGLPLINTYFGTSKISLASDGSGLYLGTNNGVFKVPFDVQEKQMVYRLVGGESGNYAHNVSGLHAQLGSDLKIVLSADAKIIYIADKDNHCIRKYNVETGIITTIVGTGVERDPKTDMPTEGEGQSVALSRPSICLDENENVIIIDTGAQVLVKWDKDTGLVSKLLGAFNGSTETDPLSTPLDGPQACAVDGSGKLYWSQKKYIKSMAKDDNKIEFVVGNGQALLGVDSSPGASTSLSDTISELFLKDGSSLYWTETDHVTKQYSGVRSLVGGTVSNVVGKNYPKQNIYNGEYVYSGNLEILPTSIAFGILGIIFNDGSNQGYLRQDGGNNYFNSIAGHFHTESDSVYYNGPVTKSIDSNLCKPTTITITQYGNFIGLTCVDMGYDYTYARIVTESNGDIIRLAGSFVDAQIPQDPQDPQSATGLPNTFQAFIRSLKDKQGIYYPFGIQLDSNGILYFADSASHTIQRFSISNGQFPRVEIYAGSTLLPCFDSTSGCGDDSRAELASLNTPTGIYYRNGVLYIADTLNYKIRKVEPYFGQNIISTIIGSGHKCESAGDASCDSSDPLQVKLNNPSNVFVTSSGDVYITDAGNSKIRKLSGGVMSVVAGSTPCEDLTNCGENVAPTSAKLYFPMGIVVDETNNDVYITDQTSTIRRISQQNNSITTYAGKMGAKLFGDSDNAVYFNSPTGLSISNDVLVVADTNNGMIRSVKMTCPDGWYGLACHITSCNTVSSIDGGVCSSHGVCSSPEICVCKNGYYGDWCEHAICNGINDTSPDLCSGHGTCADTICSCENGYSGVNCNISTTCFGVLDVAPLTCSGHGTCISQDNCTCTGGWIGFNCNITACFGIDGSDNKVCSGHGVCTAVDTCSCESGYSGDNCGISSVSVCFGVLSNDSNVCSGHGNCTGQDECLCAQSWTGSNCNVTSGGGNNTNNGNDTPQNVTYCFGIMSNNSNVCSGHGNCTGNDQCTCLIGWSGSYCNVTVGGNNENTNNVTSCFTLFSNDSNVCNGHGSCVGQDNCVCTNGWTGLNCNVTSGGYNNGTDTPQNVTRCFGLISNDSNVCSGHGSCVSQDSCVCTNGWTGANCNVTSGGNNENTKNVTHCFGLISNDSNVCSGHGSCIGQDECLCAQSWTGSNCNVTSGGGNNTNNGNDTPQNVTYCFGIMSNNSNVCSGHGKCTGNDQCTCSIGWSGSYCNVTVGGNNENTNNVTHCFGLISNDSNVCSGHGSCVGTDNCVCSSGWTGSNCNTTSTPPPAITCFGISDKDSKACSGHGSCVSQDECACSNDWTGQNCNISTIPVTCYGINEKDSNVCSGHGSCTGKDHCICSTSWSGLHCNITTCNGISSIDSSVCNGKGSCTNTDKCNCIPEWFGKSCSETKCFSVSSSESTVCGGHGTCKSPDSCSCHDNYSGVMCNITSCNGISSTDSSVCNHNGICSAYDTCICSSGWFGKDCTNSITTCFGKLSNDSTVCGGHGNCTGNDQCACNSADWIGSECSEEVPQIKISGSENILVPVERIPLYVRQYLTCSQCNLNNSMQFISIEWKQISGPSVSFTKLSSNDMMISSFSDQSSQKYEFEVSSTFKNIVTKAQITINTEEVKFGIVLYQSSVNSTHVTVGVETDPEQMLSKLGTSTWTWTCKNSDLVTDCNQSILNDLAYHALKRSTLFTLAGTSNSIQLTLKIRNTVGGLSVTFPQDQSVPIINLLTVYPQKSVLTTSEKLSLQIMISVNDKYDGIDSLIQREWKLNGKALNAPVLSSPSDASKSNLVVLDISRLSEGSSNNLTCKVTNVNSKASTVYTYSFTVAVNPKECSCSVIPSTGYALDTQFTIKCFNCLVNSETSLQYSFTDSKTKIQVPLAQSTSIQLQTVLPYTGSTILPLQITLSNIKTKAKVENLVNATVLIPKVSSVVDLNKKKSIWDTLYKTLPNGDPRKVVYGYITTTISAMKATLPARNLLLEETCLNGGVFNSETKICNCTEGFKKNDCSMTTAAWLELVNDRWLTAQLIYESFNAENQLGTQSDSKLSVQSSILYHLIEKYDEISPQQFEQGVDIFKQQIQDTKSDSYVTIPTTLSDAMSSTLGLLQKSQLSIEGKKSEVFEQVIMNCLTDLGSIKLRDQPIGDSITFESDSYALTSIKAYPTELSNTKVGEVLAFPDLMTNYLTSFDVRKPLNVRVWKQYSQSISNETVSTIDGVEITTTFKPVDYTLSLDFASAGQILSIPKDQKIISYFFKYNKVADSSVSQLVRSNKIKQINTTSEMVCLNDCLTETVAENLFACKCSQVTSVSIAERKVVRVAYVDVQIQPTVINNDYDYLAFLTFIPVILMAILIPVGIVLLMRRKKMAGEENVELKSV